LQGVGEEGEVIRGRRITTQKANPFGALRELLREHQVAELREIPPFIGGAVGFFSYDAVRQLESLPDLARRGLQLPGYLFMFFDRVLVFDHLRHQLHIVAAADVRKESPRRAYARALRDIEQIERKLARGVSREDMRLAMNERKRSRSRLQMRRLTSR